MKLRELQPNVEYLRQQGKYNKGKIKLTPEAIAKGSSKHYGNQGQIEALVWERDWGGGWNWCARMIPLSQIKRTWAEWEVESERLSKAWEQELERMRAENLKQQKETEELRQFLMANREALAEILGEFSPYTYHNRLEVKLSLETLKRLLEKVSK